MKKTVLALMFLAFLAPRADACVGKTLHIGVVDNTAGKVLAAVMSGIINERTGTTVEVQFYGSVQELIEAMKVKQVDISIEDTDAASKALNLPENADVQQSYEAVKSVYKKEKGLVWLKPFRFKNVNGAVSPAYTSAVLRLEVLNNFPALPRVIGKMGKAITDDAFTKMVRSVESGKQPKLVAREFLRSKKLI